MDSIADTDVGIELNQLSGDVQSSNNRFEDCKVSGFGYAVLSNWDSKNNVWNDCKFDNLGYGVVFGETMILGLPATGSSIGPCDNKIEKSKFTNVNRHGIWVNNGTRNISHLNSFTLVGNDAGTEKSPAYSIIKYSKNTNKSFQDYFARTENLAFGGGLTNVPYIPEVEGTAFCDLEFENNISFGRQTDFRLFRLPGVINQAYEVDYSMVSETYRVIRAGTLHVVVDAYGNNVEISDDFHFTGDETYLDNIIFNVVLIDNDADLTNDTVDVKVTSTMPTDDTTQFKFTVKAKKTDVI